MIFNYVERDKKREINMKHWYESIFEDYGKKYDNESFTQGTIGECDFIEKEINFDKALLVIAGK